MRNHLAPSDEASKYCTYHRNEAPTSVDLCSVKTWSHQKQYCRLMKIRCGVWGCHMPRSSPAPRLVDSCSIMTANMVSMQALLYKLAHR